MLLSVADRSTILAPLISAGWTHIKASDAITKTFLFPDFIQAFGFMTKVAIKSETLNHHPEWKNIYSKVEITWTTHDCKGLSGLDVQMAEFCDKAYSK